MPRSLRIVVGQYSSAGRKAINQDFHGFCIPEDESVLASKGAAVALADGISSSALSQDASRAAITGFLADYYCTSEAWSVKTSAQRVLNATNTWLHSQTQRSQFRNDLDRGYVCTFSALILKSATAHVFHIGDARVHRVSGRQLEQITRDHRVVVSGEQSYLSRALGINTQVDIDYHTLAIEEGDVFVLTTDGVHEHVEGRHIVELIHQHASDPAAAAQAIGEAALDSGSPDNLTVQLVSVQQLPDPDSVELLRNFSALPLPPMLEARARFDGYVISRELHASSRSHLYLAEDSDTGQSVVLKIPSVDLRDSPGYLERFQMEEWVARRINSAHVLKPSLPRRKRNYLYLTNEFIDGQTLAQWMIDHPAPSLETVRNIVTQIARGLQAFHRLEILHQDLRPENVMIDTHGTVKIIDFGSTRVAGLAETANVFDPDQILGAIQYVAPEYFIGDQPGNRSDLYSLGVLTYQMLSGRLPYGARVARCRTRAALKALRYESVLDEQREIPLWIDSVLKKAVHTDPARRYEELSEFIFDLRQPNRSLSGKTHSAIIERNPVLFWKGLSMLLGMIVIVLIALQHRAA